MDGCKNGYRNIPLVLACCPRNSPFGNCRISMRPFSTSSWTGAILGRSSFPWTFSKTPANSKPMSPTGRESFTSSVTINTRKRKERSGSVLISNLLYVYSPLPSDHVLLVIDHELDDLLQRGVDAAEGVIDIVAADLCGKGRRLQLFEDAFHIHSLITGRPDQRGGMDKAAKFVE